MALTPIKVLEENFSSLLNLNDSVNGRYMLLKSTLLNGQDTTTSARSSILQAEEELKNLSELLHSSRAELAEEDEQSMQDSFNDETFAEEIAQLTVDMSEEGEEHDALKTDTEKTAHEEDCLLEESEGYQKQIDIVIAELEDELQTLKDDEDQIDAELKLLEEELAAKKHTFEAMSDADYRNYVIEGGDQSRL